MINKNFYIYKITNLITGKIYIGQRCSLLTPELDSKYMGSGVVINRSKKKHGLENFKKEILEVCEIQELDSREIFWIKEFNSMNSEIGYNLAEGGKGPKGYKHSLESIEANRKRNIGRKHLSETIEKIRVGNTGKKLSEENIAGIKERMTGRIVSQETCIKISESNLGKEAWNKNIPCTEEVKQKIRLTKTGVPSGRKGEACSEKIITKLKEFWHDEEKLLDLSNKLKAAYEHREDVSCPWCNKVGHTGPMHVHHFDNCKQNPNYTPKEKAEIICPHCGKIGSTGAMYQTHFDKCPKNPDYVEPEKIISVCPHCNFIGGGHGLGSMKRWHFDNCKLKPIQL